jgi:DNA (cytosine-5)-methyltransferase 1
MNPAFRQIGNAVPPLMALALAGQMMAALKNSNSRSESGYVLNGATATV